MIDLVINYFYFLSLFLFVFRYCVFSFRFMILSFFDHVRIFLARDLKLLSQIFVTTNFCCYRHYLISVFFFAFAVLFTVSDSTTSPHNSTQHHTTPHADNSLTVFYLPYLICLILFTITCLSNLFCLPYLMHCILFTVIYLQCALIETKKTYVRYISHELRTPLNSAFLGT